MNDGVLTRAVQWYGISESRLKPLPGGHYTHVYGFARDGEEYVLRVSPSGEINLDSMRAILVWMNFLAERGASVSRPVVSRRGNLVECVEQGQDRYTIVAFEKARGVLAEDLPADQWSDRLYHNLGRAVGRMHALAKEYVPADESLRRPEWDRAGNCFNPSERLDASQAVAAEKKEEVWRYVHTLPKDRDSYGLVHTDLHGGNFFVDAGSGIITVFDFDDCAYGWYVMDIAMNLFDAVVLYAGFDEAKFATRFLKSYLRGYLAENRLSAFWVNQLPYFLKLLEIGVYTQVYEYYNPNDPDPWVGKFMPGRRRRIENDVPYVSVDFEDVLNGE